MFYATFSTLLLLVACRSKEPKPSPAPLGSKPPSNGGFWGSFFGISDPAPDEGTVGLFLDSFFAVTSEFMSPMSEGGRGVEMKSVKYRKSDVKHGGICQIYVANTS